MASIPGCERGGHEEGLRARGSTPARVSKFTS
jgi:hypothetical protein